MVDLNNTSSECLIGPLNNLDPTKITSWYALLAVIALGFFIYTVYAILSAKDDATKKDMQKTMFWGVLAFVAAMVILVVAGMITGNVNQPTPPVASFTADPYCGEANLTVLFTDHSKPQPDNRTWKFGDETSITSIDSSISHTFTKSGKYNVEMVSMNAVGKSNPFITQINVTDAPVALIAPIANFSATPSPKDPFTIIFEDTTTQGLPIIARVWDFGDGVSVFSLDQNEIRRYHTYTIAQSYDVKFIVINYNGKMSRKFNTIGVNEECDVSQYLDYKGIYQNVESQNTTNIVLLQIEPNNNKSQLWIEEAKQGCVKTTASSCNPINLNSARLCPYASGLFNATFPEKMSIFVNLTNEKRLNVKQKLDDGTLTEYNLTKFI
jgi:PKD repeat protein